MLVNCNFDNAQGNGTVGTGQYGLLGTSNDAWNNLYPNSSNVSLKNSTGVASGLTLTHDLGSSWYNSSYAPLSSPFTILQAYNNLGNGRTSGTVTISGFTGGTYDLYIYNAFQWGPSYATTTTYTVSGTSKAVSNSVNATSFVDGGNYVVFKDVTPVNGQVVITLTPTNTAGSTYGSIAALQLVSVPEPVTIGLLAIGSIWLKRRK
jgi:hypothetical protein